MRSLRTVAAAAAVLAAATCALAPGAGAAEGSAADGISIAVGSDATVTIGSRAGALVEGFGLRLTTADGTPVPVSPVMDGRSVRATILRSAYLVSASASAVGSGALLEFSAVPEQPRSSDERPPLRVELVAALSSERVVGVRLLSASDALPGVSPPTASAGQRELDEPGKAVVLSCADGETLVIEAESPGPIRVRDDRGVLRLTLTAAVVDLGGSVHVAAWVGRAAYAGAPLVLGEPEARFVEGHGCLEARVRVFGRWDDPFDAGQASLAAAWQDGGTAFTARGYYAQDFVAEMRGSDDSRREVVEPRGTPDFRVRLPASAGGKLVSLVFTTSGGGATCAVRLPGATVRPPLSAAAGVELARPGPRGTAGMIALVKEAANAGVTLARADLTAPGWRLGPDERGAIDIEAAWRIDRLLEDAGERGVALALRLDAGPDAASGTPRGRRVAYLRSRWGMCRGVFGWERAPSADAAPDGGSFVVPSSRRADGPRMLNWRSWAIAAADLEADDAPRRKLERSRSAALHVIGLPGKAARHRAIWTVAAATNARVIFASSVGPADAGPAARFVAALDPLRALETPLWFRAAEYEIVGACGSTAAKWWARCLASRDAKPASDGPAVEEDGPFGVTDAVVSLGGLEPGLYEVQWWQTYEGRRLAVTRVRTFDGVLRLSAPPFVTDIAGLAFRIDGR